MSKDQIDQAIKISETYRIVYGSDDDPKQLEAPPPREDTPPAAPEVPEAEIIETVTTKIIENPTPSELGGYGIENLDRSDSPAPARAKSRRGRSRSARRNTRETYEERDEESYGAQLVVPDRTRRSEREIRNEIKRLEEEKRALKIDERNERDVVRVEKDSNGRLSLVKSSH